MKKTGANKAGNLLEKLRALYRDYEHGEDPHINPVLRLSLSISSMLQNNDITPEDLEHAIQTLGFEGLKSRARHLSAYLGSCKEEENLHILNKLVRILAHEGDELLPFADFQTRTTHLFYGFVFTAHPTFTMPPKLAETLTGCATGLSGGEDEASFEDLYATINLPFSPPGINEESALSLQAIDNLHTAFVSMFTVLFTVAAELYPDDWTSLRPRLCSIATWVGFDMDGRKDIQWAKTLEKRIDLQIRQLRTYQESFSSLVERYPSETKMLKPALAQISETGALMEGHHGFFNSYKQDDDPDLQALQREARALIESAGKRLLDSAPLVSVVEACLKKTEKNDLKKDLLVLLAQLHTFGLSRAQVHFRINANQVHNAINNHIRLNTHPDHPSQRRNYIDKIAALLETVQPANVDFGDIAKEEMTAKYEFMLIQQIIKNIDRESPVRFLIAETESAFTLLAALYYAKRFGVDDHVDICPLFETGRALQNSSRYMQVLLNNPQYKSYIEKRGRLCIQTGYSDAGRYIGQPAAGGSIERLKERFSEIFEEYSIENISLLFFDTHGESTGRGGHPDSFSQRLHYIAPPYFLNRLKQQKISYTQESSYQGGDGFLYFLNKSATLTALTRALEHMLQDHAGQAGDPYYKEPFRSEATKFFTVATAFQSALISNPHYADFLGAFGTNIMYRSGSRAVKRMQEAEGGTAKRPEVSQIRAIPHNAILEQFGLLANTISGMGRACREYEDFVADISKESQRFQTIMSLIDYALSFSDPQITKAYISILDPTFWIIQARQCDNTDRSYKMAAIATSLEQHNLHDGMIEIYRKLDWDHTLLSRFRQPGQMEVATDIVCLHAIRLALLRDIFILATDIPRFGPHHPVTREQILRMVFHMDIQSAVEWLTSIFPVRTPQKKDYDFGEVSEYRQQESTEGYANIHAGTILPLRHMHELTQRISIAIAHYTGFFG